MGEESHGGGIEQEEEEQEEEEEEEKEQEEEEEEQEEEGGHGMCVQREYGPRAGRKRGSFSSSLPLSPFHSRIPLHSNAAAAPTTWLAAAPYPSFKTTTKKMWNGDGGGIVSSTREREKEDGTRTSKLFMTWKTYTHSQINIRRCTW